MRIDLDKTIKLNKLKRILKLFGNTNKPIKILIQGNLYDITSIVDRNNTIMFIIGDCDDESLVGYVASRVETEQSAITIAQELLDEYNEKGYYIRRHISGNNRLPHEKMDDEIVNPMNAGSVDDLFNQAWAEYENLKHEVKIFVEENNLNYDFFKVEMVGPHVTIKHSLPDILWTEELHDKFCEAFGVHLQYFKRTLSKSQRKKPPLGGFHWVYGATAHDEKFIVPYDELPLERDDLND